MSYTVVIFWQSGAAGVDDPALQRRVLAAGNACASAYKELLEHINVVCIAVDILNRGLIDEAE